MYITNRNSHFKNQNSSTIQSQGVLIWHLYDKEWWQKNIRNYFGLKFNHCILGVGVKDPVRLLSDKNYLLLSTRTKFKSWYPQAGWREPSPSSCSLTSTHASRHTCRHTHEVNGCVCAAKIPQFKHGKPWVCTLVSGCPMTVQSGFLTKDTAQSPGEKLSEATQPQYYLVLNLFLFLCLEIFSCC